MKKAIVFLLILFFPMISFADGPIGAPPPPKTGLKTYTVATLPSAATHPNMAIIVTDGATATDCETTGSGTTRNICVSNGTNWIIAGDGSGTAAGVEDDVYGSGWSTDDINAPSQSAVYDYLHLMDTDDDGDIDNVDGAVGGGDITGVGPGGTGAGDALIDGYVTQNTTSMFVWEGPTDDTVEYLFVLPAADPITADTTWTYPSESGVFIVGEADGYADNTVLTIDGAGGHLTQETAVTIDGSNNMAGIGTLGASGVVTFADTTEASAIGTAALVTAGGLGVAKDVWVGDDLVLDSDSTVISLGADQDIKITHTADQGITVFEGTEEILILKDGGSGSAANEITILSAATTASPTIQQTGEADIGIDFETVNNEEMLQLDAVAAGTNNLKIANAANSASPSIVAVGSSDANVGILIDAKAAGEIIIGSADAKFSLVSDALDISNAGNISNAGTIGCGAITSTGAIEGTSVTDGTVTLVGDGTITGIAEGGLTDSIIVAADIKDGTITENDLSASFAFDDGDYINLSGITQTADTAEGLVLPTWANVSVTGVAGGTIAFDEASDAIYVKTGDGWESIGTSAAPVDAQYLVVADSGNLTADRTVSWGTGLSASEAGSPITLTIVLAGEEVDDETWGNNTTGTWTFDGGGTDATLAYGDAVLTLSHLTVDNDIILDNAEVIDNDTDGSIIFTDGTNEIAILKTVASAAAELTFSPATTGGNPVISTTGENDAGIVFQNAEGEEFLLLDSVGTDENYLKIVSSADGTGLDNQVSLTAVGDDTNVGMIIDPKGTGTLTLGSADANLVIASDAFDVSESGALSGITTAAMSGALTIQGAINLGTGGVVFTDDGDGLLTITGAGDGSDENLTLNFDDTANTVVINTGTSVGTIDFSAIALTTTGNLTGATITAATSIVAGDDDRIILGAGSDINIEFDEDGTDALLVNTQMTDAAGSTDENALIVFAVDADSNASDDMDADQEVFEIGKGGTDDSDADYVELLALDEDGDLTIAGSFITAASNDPYWHFNVLTSGDTDWWITVDDDAGGDDDDSVKFSTTGQNDATPEFELQTDGDFIAEGKLKGTALILEGGDEDTTIDPGTPEESVTYTWPLADGEVGEVLATDSNGTLDWTAVTATPAGSNYHIQWNNGTALDSEAAFTYNDDNNTLNITKSGSNPAITVGDGSYSIGNSALLYVEGVLEVQEGIAYFHDGVDINEDLDINFDAADEEIAIDQAAVAGTEDVGLIKINDDRTGATATEQSEATIWIDAEGVYAISIVDGSLSVEGDIVPAATDGAALGTDTLDFSDIFLATGAVINLSSGDVTITHSTNGLDFAGATSSYTFDDAVDITGTEGLILENDETITNATNGIITLTGDASIVSGAPRIQFDDSGGAGADDDAGAIDYNMTTPTDGAEVSDFRMSWYNAGTEQVGILMDGSTHSMSIGVLPNDWTGGDVAGYESLMFDFDYGEPSIAITSPSGATLLNLGIATLGMSDNTAAITHSGSTSLTISSTSGTVGVESVVFAAGDMSSAAGSLSLTAAANDQDITFTIDDAGTDKTVTLDGSESTVNFGADDLYVNLIVHDGGTFTMYEDSNDFSISLGVTNGESTLALTGALTISTTLGVTGIGTFSDTTEASAIGTAALVTAGGLGVAYDIWMGDDLVMDSDAAVINLGADQDVLITHVADTGMNITTTANTSGTINIGNDDDSNDDSIDLVLHDSGIITLYDANDDTSVSLSVSDGVSGLTLDGDLVVSGGDLDFGNVAVTIGANTEDSFEFDTDGTGDAEIVLPDDSIGPAEIATDAVTMDSVDSDGNFQALTGNWLTTGTLQGSVDVDLVTTSATVSLTATQAHGSWQINNYDGTADFDLPTPVAGMTICFRSNYAHTVTVDVGQATTDQIWLDDTLLNSGDSIDSAAAAGDFVCLLAIDSSTWVTLGMGGTWTDGGA